jgi:hypothetical protein
MYEICNDRVIKTAVGDINTKISDKTYLLFNFISNIAAKNLKIDLREFCDTFLNKWNATTFTN